jgi:hypothetical protein
MKHMEPLEPMKPMAPMPTGERWWPQGLGEPATAGSQDGLRYAFFPDKQPLLIKANGKVKTFDSGRHRIGGVFQENSKTPSLCFTSQHGPVRVDDLKQLS